MNKIYAVYSQLVASPERDALLEKHPNCATYGDQYYLFCESYEQAFGEAGTETVDLSGYVLTDTPENPNEITPLQFDQMTAPMEQNHTGREIILSVQQGRHLALRYVDEPSE